MNVKLDMLKRIYYHEHALLCKPLFEKHKNRFLLTVCIIANSDSSTLYTYSFYLALFDTVSIYRRRYNMWGAPFSLLRNVFQEKTVLTLKTFVFPYFHISKISPCPYPFFMSNNHYEVQQFIATLRFVQHNLPVCSYILKCEEILKQMFQRL